MTGGAAVFTVNPGGSATILPNIMNQNQGVQNLSGAGSGVSDTNTHTTYFSPADWSIVNGDPTYGTRLSPRSFTQQAIGYYNTGDYYNINTELRELASGKRRSLTPETQRVVDAMDRNMRPLNNDIEATRWTDTKAIASNLGMPGASKRQIVAALQNNDITRIKDDFTSSTWNKKKSSVAGKAGRDVKINMMYKKGSMAQFSPTKKEWEMVGARGKPQRYSNARIERTLVTDPRGNYHANILVVDCYVDS